MPVTRTLSRIPGTEVGWEDQADRVVLPGRGRNRLRWVGVESAVRHYRDALPRLVWNMVALDSAATRAASGTATLPPMSLTDVHTLLGGVTVGGRPLDEERRVLELATRAQQVARDAGGNRSGRGPGTRVPGFAQIVDAAVQRYVRSVVPQRDGTRDLASAQLALATDLLCAGVRVPLIPRSRKVELDHAVAASARGDDTELIAFVRDCAVM